MMRDARHFPRWLHSRARATPGKRDFASAHSLLAMAVLLSCFVARPSYGRGQSGAGAPPKDLKPPSGNPANIALAQAFQKGPSNAPVTVIEFTDFECPYCGKAAPVIHDLAGAYPNKIRFIFKNNPLPIHSHALLAHEAALAAGAQGKFWEMHDLLFANQVRLNEDDLVQYAKQLNLDLEAFREALRSHRYKPLIESDLAEAQGLGVTGTPTFFVNGRKVVGAQSLEVFKGIMDQALGLANPATAGQGAGTGAQARKTVSIGQAPVRGAQQAPVTIVEFSDFQCPFCARALPTVQQLLQDYPAGVRLVFKNFPLDFHRDSLLAHEAALAAREQGKFWEMHDRIFASQQAMKRDDLLRMAKDLGLDMNKFVADLDSGRFKAVVEADRAEGARLGVNGTPTFFVNGAELEGARPVDQFKSVIEVELRTASKGGPAANTQTAPKTPSSASSPARPAALPVTSPGQPLPPSSGLQPPLLNPAGPARGPEGAPVTIVWFSDLESPLSPQAAALLRQVMEAYPAKVRVLFKNLPLEFHKDARLAHEAALAAGAQGKFWEMVDLILANQKAVQKDDLLRYAAQLKLDPGKFQAALDARTYRAKVDEDLAEARRLNVSGVPAFFVNGKRVDGMQPFPVFKAIIEAQLAGNRSQGAGNRGRGIRIGDSRLR